MIYTITFNPALDYVIQVDDFKLGSVNRIKKEAIYYGGKGINVSYILKQLDIVSEAIGFIAGFTGKELVHGIEKKGLKSNFIEVTEGMTRINVKLRSNEESEINGMGPVITQSDIDSLYHKLDKLVSGDILVLSGSIPNCLPNTIYQDIMAYLKEKDIKFIVDATKDLLMNVLPYNPFLIKPNHHELADMFNVTINNDEEIVFYAKKLQELGARNVLISMAGDGAILVDENQDIHKTNVPKGTVKNSVGAGDSMVAGFIAGYIKHNNYEDALLLASACGSATAYSDDLATHDLINSLLEELK